MMMLTQAAAAEALQDVEEAIVHEAEAAGEPAAVASITRHPRADRNQHLRIVEAVLFATAEPVDAAHLAGFLPEGTDVAGLLADLQSNYANRGVNLVEVAGKWLFRTADDLGYILRRETVEQRKLSKAAMETLAIIAYHQPVTRAEIEDKCRLNCVFGGWSEQQIAAFLKSVPGLLSTHVNLKALRC